MQCFIYTLVANFQKAVQFADWRKRAQTQVPYCKCSFAYSDFRQQLVPTLFTYKTLERPSRLITTNTSSVGLLFKYLILIFTLTYDHIVLMSYHFRLAHILVILLLIYISVILLKLSINRFLIYFRPLRSLKWNVSCDGLKNI